MTMTIVPASATVRLIGSGGTATLDVRRPAGAGFGASGAVGTVGDEPVESEVGVPPVPMPVDGSNIQLHRFDVESIFGRVTPLGAINGLVAELTSTVDVQSRRGRSSGLPSVHLAPPAQEYT